MSKRNRRRKLKRAAPTTRPAPWPAPRSAGRSPVQFSENASSQDHVRRAILVNAAQEAQDPESCEFEMVETQHEFDGRLMGRAHSYWQFGEWNKLTDISLEEIATHPERAKLSLLLAAGHQQLGQYDAVKHLVTQARIWGVDNRQVARILLAGTYQILGRAALLRGSEPRAKRLFREAIDLAMPGSDSQLWHPIRREIAERELLHTLGRDELLTHRPRLIFEAMHRHGGILANGARSNIDVPTRAKNNQRTVIVIAGMRHSGSTVLFNIIRLALELCEIKFRSGYSEAFDISQFRREPVLLVKTHELRDDLLEKTDIVLTTVRDLRNSVASAKRRKFALFQKLGTIEYAKLNRQLHEIWAPLSAYEFRYERFMTEPQDIINDVLDLLCLDPRHLATISAAVHNLPTDQYEKTLLSPTHITDPDRIYDYNVTLTSDEIREIECIASAWLRRLSYETGTKSREIGRGKIT